MSDDNDPIARLRTAAEAALAAHFELGLTSDPMMTVIMRKRPKGFPRICERSDGARVYHVCPNRVLAWIEKIERDAQKENSDE